MNSKEILHAATALLLVGLTVPGAAMSQTPTRVTAEDTEARQYFERGMQFIANEQWADAASALRRARQLRPIPPVLYNLGLAERALGHDLLALEAVNAYLAAAGPSGTRRAEAEQMVRALQAHLGHVELEVLPADAHVRVDLTDVAADHRRIDLDPGPHVLQVRAEGFLAREQPFDLAPGSTVQLRVPLEALVSAPPPTRPLPIGSFVLLGTAVVGGAATGLFAFLRGSAFARFEAAWCSPSDPTGIQRCAPLPPEGHPDYTAGVQMTVVTDVALGVSLAAAASGAIWLGVGLATRRTDRSAQTAVAVMPMVQSSTTGLAVGGTF